MCHLCLGVEYFCESFINLASVEDGVVRYYTMGLRSARIEPCSGYIISKLGVSSSVGRVIFL